jgi:hypothetical protein
MTGDQRMLTVIVSGKEIYNEETQEFSSFDDFVLELEHSLVSLSKWEQKFQKPFLTKEDKTPTEILWYVKAMILNDVYPEDLIERLTQDNLNDINEYIESSQSATTFGSMPETRSRGKTETITSELIYYWMIAFNIPFETQYWHLNRLFSLIRICNVKNSKPKKMSKGEIAQRNRELNAQRRQQLGTSG